MEVRLEPSPNFKAVPSINSINNFGEYRIKNVGVKLYTHVKCWEGWHRSR